MNARERAARAEKAAIANEKRFEKTAKEHEKTVSQTRRLLNAAFVEGESHAFSIGLWLDQLEGRDEQSKIGNIRVETFVVRVSVWLPKVGAGVPPERVTRVTKFLASLACVALIDAVGGGGAAAAAAASMIPLWERSEIHTLTATDVIEEGSKLYTEMGFQFSIRVLGQNTPTASLLRKLTSNEPQRPVETLLVEVLQGVLTTLGQLQWRFAGRRPIIADPEYVNVVRNEVRIRNDGTWKFADYLNDGSGAADPGQDAPDVLTLSEPQKRKAAAADRRAQRQEAALQRADDADRRRRAEAELNRMGPLESQGPDVPPPPNPLVPADEDVF